jgi:hypothetical protein
MVLRSKISEVMFQNLKSFEKKIHFGTVTSKMVRFCEFGFYNSNNWEHFKILGEPGSNSGG